MAIGKHVKIVRRGILAIMSWRQRNPIERLDLNGADLEGVHLKGADLRGADIRGAKLARASLIIANLFGVDLEGADLSEAKLKGADLRRARLVACRLFRTDFTGARMGATLISNCDLRSAIGLAEVLHDEPNIITPDIVTMSGGKVPSDFLPTTQADSSIPLDSLRVQMTDKDYLALLKEGPKSWNEWRRNHPDVCPNLQGADFRGNRLSRFFDLEVFPSTPDFRGVDLRGANLSDAEISEMNLDGTNLSGANLSRANLSGVRMRQAILQEANLRRANLAHADISDGDLTRAKLNGANLNSARLENADLSEADVSEADLEWAFLAGARLLKVSLSESNLTYANLSKSNLENADLSRADLRHSMLTGAVMRNVDLRRADLEASVLDDTVLVAAHLGRANLVDACGIGVNLSKAILMQADLSGAVFKMADLQNANLKGARLDGADFEDTNLDGCLVYGVSAWDVKLVNTTQTNLVITSDDIPTITVDNLKVAEFIYSLLDNKSIRDSIDTVTQKVVLILGRFTQKRIAILKAIREEIRKYNYVPVLFDFDKPRNRDLTETVSTVAHLARFVIADITEPKSIAQELAIIVPHLPSVPVQPLLEDSEPEYGMFEHFKRYPWRLFSKSSKNLYTEGSQPASKPLYLDKN